MKEKYRNVTEMAGESISKEQLDRAYTRYQWAKEFCYGKDVLEAACGVGQGLGLLHAASLSLTAGDIDEEILEKAKSYYKERIDIRCFPAETLPVSDSSLDVVILFEAIYYLPNFSLFLKECSRVLRKDGIILMCMPNKDLYDFNPSPHSTTYYNAMDLEKTFQEHGFIGSFFASTPVSQISWKQKILRPLKKLAVSFNLMPKSMKGKEFLKRIVFGEMVVMPPELIDGCAYRYPVTPLSSHDLDKKHKVIYCHAQKK